MSCRLFHGLECKVQHSEEYSLNIRAAKPSSVVVAGEELQQSGMGGEDIVHNLLLLGQSFQIAGGELFLQEERINMVQSRTEKANLSAKSELPLLNNLIQ